MTAMTATQIKTKIAKLTGRLPASNNVDYLARRLSMLQRASENGEDVRRAVTTDQAIVSISMSTGARDALNKIAERERLPVSRVVRMALREFAVSRSYREARALDADLP